MSTRLLEVTDLPCPGVMPQADGSRLPHHLRRGVCVLCSLTEDRIKNSTPLLHLPAPCHCDSCHRAGVPLCVSCHLSFTVHPRRKSDA